MKEIIWIHIGEAGIRIGQQFWELAMREHGIGKDGRIMEEEKRGNPQVLFYEDENNVFIPRALFWDHDSMAIEELMKTNIGQLLKPDQLVFGKESACYFSKVHFSYNNEFLDRWQSLIARLIEEWTNLDWILFFYSLSGGTGTGFGSRLLQIFSTSFGKIHKVAISILPSEDNSSLIIEPYNFVLGFHDLIEHLDFNIWFDNQSLYKICKEKLKIEQPSFCDINRLICKHVSSVYSSIRFSSQDTKINEDTFVSMQSETGWISTQKILANWVPYYRMHFLLPSFSPFIAEIDSHKVVHSVESISTSVLNSGSYMAYFDENYSKSIGSMLSYKGDVQYSDIIKNLPDVREKNKSIWMGSNRSSLFINK